MARPNQTPYENKFTMNPTELAKDPVSRGLAQKIMKPLFKKKKKK
jgi:hypothetical protein